MIYKILAFLLMINNAVTDQSVKSVNMRNVKRSCSKIEYYDRLRQRCRDFPGGGYLVIVDHSSKCANGDQGLHKFNRNDFYYVCHPEGVMIGMCPTDMIFSDTEKKCVKKNDNSTNTIRIYDESNDCGITIPNCNGAGMYSVPTNCSFYYDCQESNYDYHQYVYKCPHQTMFHPDLHRCITMTRCYPEHYDIFDRFDYDYFPRCVIPGQFRTSNDCSLYYRCIPNMDGSFFQIRYECPTTMYYDIAVERCEVKHSDKCEYIIWDNIITDYALKHNLSYDIHALQNTTVISTINTTIATSSPSALLMETTHYWTESFTTSKSLLEPVNQTQTNAQDDIVSTTQYSDHTPITDFYQTNETSKAVLDLKRIASTNEITTESVDITSESSTDTHTSTGFTVFPTTNKQIFSTRKLQPITNIHSTAIDHDQGPTQISSTSQSDHLQLTTTDSTNIGKQTTKHPVSDDFEHFTWDDESWSRGPQSHTTTKPRVRYYPGQGTIKEIDSDYWDNRGNYKFPGTVMYSTVPATIDSDTTNTEPGVTNITTTTPDKRNQTKKSKLSTTEQTAIFSTEMSTDDSDISSEAPEQRTPADAFPLDSDEPNSGNHDEPVLCFNDDTGGLTCDDIRGKRGGSFVIPGYIIRYRQRKNKELEAKPNLDARINLHLRYPTSYLIEAIARQRNS